jgi:biotin-(acetyl-CoA carboxylase) ligase
VIEGLAQGIDADGALRVRTESGSRRFLAAEVSVRAAA